MMRTWNGNTLGVIPKETPRLEEAEFTHLTDQAVRLRVTQIRQLASLLRDDTGGLTACT